MGPIQPWTANLEYEATNLGKQCVLNKCVDPQWTVARRQSDFAEHYQLLLQNLVGEVQHTSPAVHRSI